MYRTREVVEMVVGIKGGSWVGRWMGRVEGRYLFQVGCKPGFNFFSPRWDASQDLTF